MAANGRGDRARERGRGHDVYSAQRTHTKHNLSSISSPTVAVLGEGTSGAPDEGYVKFTREIVAAIRPHRPVTEFVVAESPASSAPLRLLQGFRRLHDAVRSQEVRDQETASIIYASRSSCTLPALLRARVVKLSARGSTVAMVALQPRHLSGLQGLIARLLWPDLLLVGTTAERDRYRRRGARAEVITGGVDLSRYRPPGPGEKEALRASWGLPVDRNIVLHVGHATSGRNLEALIPLAAAPGITMVVVLSSRPGPGVAARVAELRRHGVQVMQGYLAKVEELYRLADCYVFPTMSTDHVIALPLSVIEALASGLPVATTPVGALAERFADEPGVRFARSDHLLEAVQAQLRDRPPTRRLAEPYSWSARADQLLRLVDDARERDVVP